MCHPTANVARRVGHLPPPSGSTEAPRSLGHGDDRRCRGLLCWAVSLPGGRCSAGCPREQVGGVAPRVVLDRPGTRSFNSRTKDATFRPRARWTKHPLTLHPSEGVRRGMQLAASASMDQGRMRAGVHTVADHPGIGRLLAFRIWLGRAGDGDVLERPPNPTMSSARPGCSTPARSPGQPTPQGLPQQPSRQTRRSRGTRCHGDRVPSLRPGYRGRTGTPPRANTELAPT